MIDWKTHKMRLTRTNRSLFNNQPTDYVYGSNIEKTHQTS